MAKTSVEAQCGACGRREPRWLGRCPGCGAWGSMVEQPDGAAASSAGVGGPAEAVPIARVEPDPRGRLATGLGEVDRVLGGGLVPGSVVLLGGEPGAGKSTLLLQLADRVARAGRTVLVVSAEEAPGQVRLAAERAGAMADRLLLAGETRLPAVVELVERHQPDLLVLDSIQTVSDPQTSGVPGSPPQVRDAAARLAAEARQRSMATVLVGHVTKDGQLAGPRVLEHLVDAVVELAGDRHHAVRLLRAEKNRHGPVGEVGCLELTERGLVEVADPAGLFAGGSADGESGVARTVTLEGSRPLVCEVQALAAPSPLAHPRRVAVGLDGQRLALLAAVLERRGGVGLAACDLYVAGVGGARLVEPAADLAVCLALASSCADAPLPDGSVAVGEVGLAGEVREVPRTAHRLAEAARLGLRRAVVARAYDGPDAGLDLRRVDRLSDALEVLGRS